MKKWRTITILSALAAVVVLVVSTQLAWEPVDFMQRARPEFWSTESPFLRRFDLQAQSHSLLGIFSILATIYLSGILLLYAFPEKIRLMELNLAADWRNLVKVFLLGLLISTVLFTIGVSSSLTMATFPLAIILGVVLFFAAFLGFVSLAYSLGRLLINRAGWEKASPLLMYLLGLILLFGLAEIPYLGIVLRLVQLMVGIGLATSTRFGSGKPWSLSALYED